MQHEQLVDDEAQAQRADEESARALAQASSHRKGGGRGGGGYVAPPAPKLAAFVPPEMLSQENKAANAPPTQWQVPSSILPFVPDAQQQQQPAQWQAPFSIPEFVPAVQRTVQQPSEQPRRVEPSASFPMNAEHAAALRVVTAMGFDPDQATRVLMSHGWLVDAAIKDLVRDNF